MEVLTLEEWIAAHHIRMDAKLIEQWDAGDPWKRKGWAFFRAKWQITLLCDQRSMVIPWEGPAGEAWKFWQDSQSKNNWLYFYPDPSRERAKVITWFGLKQFKPKPPKIADVIECIVSDCQGVEWERDFESWASSLGYDPDSRSAEKIYHTIEQQIRDFQSLVGRQAYRNLVLEED